MGPADELLWDDGNLEHATRHGVSREEMDGMYGSGAWILLEDPQGRAGQFRLVGPAPSGRFITVAVEWIGAKRAHRPISAWASVRTERREWSRQMLTDE